MDVSQLVQTVAIYALPVLFAITLHEAAHGYVARHFGDMTAFAQGRISLNPARHVDLMGTIVVPILILVASKFLGGAGMLFGWAKPVPVNYSALRKPRQHMAWVAAAGPAANLAKAKEELLAHTQALGNLISPDGKDLNLLVYLDVSAEMIRLDPLWSVAQGKKDRAALAELEAPYEAALKENREKRAAMVEGVRATTARWGAPKLSQPPLLSGLPIITVNLVEHVTSDLRVFGIASFAIFLAAFALVYRRPRWTAGPACWRWRRAIRDLTNAAWPPARR